MLSNIIQAQVFYDKTSSSEVLSIEGGAVWDLSSNGDFVYNNNGSNFQNRALIYSTSAYQSEDGFKLTIEYTTESIEDVVSHNFSFGLISDETNLSSYLGFNPFRANESVYSIGANLTTNEDATARGLNFTNGNERVTLDESGSRTQFGEGGITKVTIEIGIGGYWSYRINDIYEDSGVLLEGFDLSKNYHVAVYGQSNNGKSIQSITLEKRYALGERAVNLRGTWNSEILVDLLDDRIKNLKTLNRLGVSFTNGAVLSAEHKVPHKLFDRLSGGDVVAPSWGDLNSDTPDNDNMLADILKIKAAGFNVKAYTNSENFVGTNADYLQPFVDSWKEYCDTDPEVQAFINSQPYHTGIWNRTTEQYEDATATYPNRKYMFCYAEYFLKDYALRYGEHFDSWIFDDGATMEQNGDNATSGVVEEQRIYQAYANAVHAGNPDIAIAFNNGRSTVNYKDYPFAHAVRFEDFTFGHAFGGNNNHAEKINGNQFNLNYRHITRMTETNGLVHAGGNWDWDDKIVGNFHSKLSTTAWKYGPNQAWEQADFNQWNLEAIQAGGSMTWGGSFNRAETAIYDWVYVLLEGLDDYLVQYGNPGAPNWARQHTVLPPAHIGIPYHHVLVEGVDLWDPEGDEITEVIALGNFPSWLKITKKSPGEWTFSGTPTETNETTHTFSLQASDASGVRTREVNLLVDEELEADPIAIKASSNTNYGLNNKAVMISDVYTAPDGYATFRVSMDVTPPSNKAVISGISGGTSTQNSWGLGDGTDANMDDIFTGSDHEWVESINNLQIVDFNANGGDLTEDHFTLSFKAITIVNAQSTNDFVSLKFDQTVVDLGKLGNQTQQIDLNSVSSINEITEFSLGTGNDSSTNKWSVEEILISLNIVVGDLSNSTIASEKNQTFKVYPNPTSHIINFNIPIHSVEVINTSGKVVKTNPNLTQSIKILDLSSGVYIIKGITELGATVVKKIVKNTN
ncbi:glycoside hydrolase family 107 [Wenyingzhuangia fucanilytica]|uniref:Glycoside hydrolase family 107 n=1 Tax=Wenyingzhuangia fucanilytica TaxID=1790137 RepID=A0A1B1Y5S0_9FLAO|nr:T9SS type A sorting domain-containing protein [Wenyingzhuangia fucanilytica]ANW96115.1 glycoside hydrolase family 107 [Wenyingzhuangia fucanilytica]